MIYLPPRREIDVAQVVAVFQAEGQAPVMDVARRVGWAFDRCLNAIDEAARRGLAERPELRRDSCPKCGAERFELVVVPGRFYCQRCGVATEGPNTEPPGEPEPEQIDLFAPVAATKPPPPAKGVDLMHDLMGSLGMEDPAYAPPAEEAPLPDEGMAWVSEEGPGE